MELPPKSKYSEIIAHDTPEDLAAARDADLGVTNYYTSYARQFGPDLPVRRDPRAAEAAKSRPHYSRRGGSSFPEVDEPEFRTPTYHETTPEERQEIRDGSALLRQVARGASLRRAALSGDPSEVRRVLAMQQRDDERHGS